jgi:hemolysin III
MRKFSKGHELANTLTHLFGIILFASFLPALFMKMMDDKNIAYLWTVFMFSFGLLMMVYGASTIYHHIKNEKLKKTLKNLGSYSYLFLIGGTYTPLVAKYLPYEYSFLVFSHHVVNYCCRSYFKDFFSLVNMNFLSVFSYLFLGWMAVFVFKDFVIAVLKTFNI